MTEDDSKKFYPRAQPRVPLKLKVNLEFEKFSGFISEYSENISEGGMFIKTETPKPVGSIFSMEFKLKDDYKLIQGWGEVTWVREKTKSPEKPAGMGIKFLDLDQPSKHLIKSIISIHKKEGKSPSTPFDINAGPPEDVKTEKKDSTTDISGLTKEVFQTKPPQLHADDSDNMVSDIFADINQEMQSQPEKEEEISIELPADSEPVVEKAANAPSVSSEFTVTPTPTISTEAPTEPAIVVPDFDKQDLKTKEPKEAFQELPLSTIKEPSSNQSPELKVESQPPKKDSSLSEIMADVEPSANTPEENKPKDQEAKSEETSFIDEVFGSKEESDTASEIKDIAEIPPSEEVGSMEMDTAYVAVKWYHRPSTVLTFLIILLAVLAGYLYHEKIFQTALILADPWLNKKQQSQISKKAEVKKRPIVSQQSVAKIQETAKISDQIIQNSPVAPAQPTVTATKIIQTPVAKPTLDKTAVKVAAKPVTTPKVVKKSVKKAITRISEIGIKKISLKRVKTTGTMIVNVNFEKNLPSYGLKGQYLPSPPRYLVKASGINKPYKRMKYTIVNPYLKKIRMGLHSSPDELHMVFDLGKPVRKNMVTMTKSKAGFTLKVGP